MTEQEKKTQELKEKLNSSKFKMCADCVEAQVVVYVTEEHVLLSDKVYKKNQMIIPFSKFRNQFENYLNTLNNGDSKVSE